MKRFCLRGSPGSVSVSRLAKPSAPPRPVGGSRFRAKQAAVWRPSPLVAAIRGASRYSTPKTNHFKVACSKRCHSRKWFQNTQPEGLNLRLFWAAELPVGWTSCVSAAMQPRCLSGPPPFPSHINTLTPREWKCVNHRGGSVVKHTALFHTTYTSRTATRGRKQSTINVKQEQCYIKSLKIWNTHKI